MKDNALLLLVLAALAAFGGLVLSLGVGFAPVEGSEVATMTACSRAHPEWDSSICQGIAEGRYTARDVLEHPTWDWEAIGAGRPQLGMTTSMVQAAWGVPDYTNSTGTGGYDDEWAIHDHLMQFNAGRLLRMIQAPVWTVDDILTATEADEAGFAEKIRGRTTLIAGRIADWGSELDGSPRIEFESPDHYAEIQCFFAPERSGEIGGLRRGQSVVILGLGDGIGPVGPTFRACRVFAKP